MTSFDASFPVNAIRDRNLLVLKFGGSVLADENALRIAVHDIYREVRQGRRVLAVVSAMSGTTDRLLEQARQLVDDPSVEPDPAGLAQLLATGEQTAAAMLALSLSRAGIPATLFDAHRAGLSTRGPLLDAELCGIDDVAIRRALQQKPVAILPGFVGCGPEGEVTLLGRGGTDLTAVFAAGALGAGTLRFVKDVGGIFEADPKCHASARCFRSLSWSQALALGEKVIQGKALHYSAQHRVPFEVGSLGGKVHTWVGSGPSRFEELAPAQAPLLVALAGLGSVGLGVYRALARLPEQFEVVGVAVRQLEKHRFQGVPRDLLTDDPGELFERGPQVFIELIGGTGLAAELIAEALRRGIDVVTANKAVIAQRGPELEAQAAQCGARLCFSAAVGGGVPVIEAIRRIAADQPPVSIEGVLNGTTNFVLERLAEGTTFDQAVRQAQAAGFAEADPTLDLNGADAAHKLAILIRAAFGVDFDWSSIPRQGLETVDPESVLAAAQAGRAVRLVASCELTSRGIQARVQPVVLPNTHPLAGARNEENRVVITSVSGDRLVLEGKGAGRWPTAEAVVSDLLELARERSVAFPESLQETQRAKPV